MTFNYDRGQLTLFFRSNPLPSVKKEYSRSSSPHVLAQLSPSPIEKRRASTVRLSTKSLGG